MGMTDELKVGHYFKRLTAIDTTFGNGDLHRERFWQAGEAPAEEPVRKPAKKWKQLV
jgi:hypothetical protein